MIGYDDALDTFGVHAVGGTLGAFLTGVLADPSVNGNIQKTASGSPNPATANGLADIILRHMSWLEQLKAMVFTIVLAVIGTIVIGFVVKAVIGLRPTADVERQGLDINEHGEEGYVL
jgi:Amt family ammonium transporter